MPHRHLKRLALLLIAFLWLTPSTAFACVVSPNPPVATVGPVGSLALANGSVSVSSSQTGISCVTLLEVVTNSYLGLMIEGAIPELKSDSSTDTIPLIVSWTENGTALTANTIHTDHTTTILGLLKASGGIIPLHFRTGIATSVRPGTYTATLNLRWFYSMCLVGVGDLCVPAQSEGFTRNGCIWVLLVRVCLGTPTSWGTGDLSKVTVRMTVERDCSITAPTIDFGSHPLPERFPNRSGSLDIRCGPGAAYSVAMNNGANAASGVRRLKSGISHLNYDIYQGTTGTSRWGEGSESRPSSTADNGSPIYDGTAMQRYNFNAKILPGQDPVPEGIYKDTVRISVNF